MGKFVLIFVGLLPIAGYCEWSPNFSEYRDHFEANARTFDLLAKKLIDSKFSSVTVFGDDRAEGWFETGDALRQEFLEGDNEWRDLLDKSELHAIGKCGLGICASFGNDPFSGNKQGYFQYVRPFSNPLELSPCRTDDEDRHTGRCAIQLNKIWWATYGWQEYDR